MGDGKKFYVWDGVFSVLKVKEVIPEAFEKSNLPKAIEKLESIGFYQSMGVELQ